MTYRMIFWRLLAFGRKSDQDGYGTRHKKYKNYHRKVASKQVQGSYKVIKIRVRHEE